MLSAQRGRGSSSSAAPDVDPSEPSVAKPRTPSKRSKKASTSGGKDPVEETLGSPPKRARPRGEAGNPKVVTPASESTASVAGGKKRGGRSPRSPRRSLDLSSVREDDGDSTDIDESKSTAEGAGKVTGKTKLPFGRNVKQIEIPRKVSRVYKIVHSQTGSVGGNGHGGAIYGELTTGSMQKMTNLMMKHTNLDKTSRFIDVGCGLGKPNLHVAQYPGVEFSYGIELYHTRWMLGMSNLQQVMVAALSDFESGEDKGDEAIGHRLYFAHGDITEATHFDPFTHVYMFDIGFPPTLFHQLAEMFNNSQSEYLICYHGPKLMIEDYGFNIELIVQTPTSMHGSSEVHTGYIYRRSETAAEAKSCETKKLGVLCDPLFAKAYEMCQSGLKNVHDHTNAMVESNWGVSSRRRTRSVTKRQIEHGGKKTE